MKEIEEKRHFIIGGIREGESLLVMLISIGKRNSIKWLKVVRMINDLKDGLSMAWKLRRIEQSKTIIK